MVPAASPLKRPSQQESASRRRGRVERRPRPLTGVRHQVLCATRWRRGNGRKVAIIACDDGGIADNARRLVQEMIVNDKVGLIGIGTTPCLLAMTLLVTEAKIPTLVLSSGASITLTKPPYVVEAGFLRVGLDHGQMGIQQRQQAGPLEIVESIRIPLAILDFKPSCSVSATPIRTSLSSIFSAPRRHLRQAIRRDLGKDHRPRRSDGRRRSRHHGQLDAPHHHVWLVFVRPRFGAQQADVAAFEKAFGFRPGGCR
jgi:hypothetical protein